jgi:fructokinase
VDVSCVQRVQQPTREVYVVRTLDGDRTFDSFGHDTNTYCDCFIQAQDLPKDKIRAAEVLVLGTLGLAYPVTNKAMHEAIDTAQEADTMVLIDVNWRPVFFDKPEEARKDILPFVHKADVVKITDEEVEWAFNLPPVDALAHPNKVLHTCLDLCYMHSMHFMSFVSPRLHHQGFLAGFLWLGVAAQGAACLTTLG